MASKSRLAAAALICAAACADSSTPGRDGGQPPVQADAQVGPGDGGLPLDAAEPRPNVIQVQVRLDGEPVEGARILQGGQTTSVLTDLNGHAVIQIDPDVPGTAFIVASHPEARIQAVEAADGGTKSIDLTRFDPRDNADYRFPDPGEPTRRNNTAQCAHCHQTINESWFASPHRSSARNPWVQALYAGTADGLADASACVEAGGQWLSGLQPGTQAPTMRCYVGLGALQTLNPQCRDGACDTAAQDFGPCANCHAPGMDGQLGGRDLLQASGHAYDYGVHCAVCHSVESVDLDEEAGIAGRLKLLRPSEPASQALGAGGFLPLTFGPSHDSPNPRMGSVQRAHFRNAELCAGCHEYSQPSLREDRSLDATRWPDGKLPIHSTYSEWRLGPFGPDVGCQQCHMPPDPTVLNGGDLQRFPDGEIGIVGGFIRPPGSVRKHSWVGPRAPTSRMLQLAAALFVEKTVSGDVLTVQVHTKNVAAGHAIPTGEPMRMLILRIQAQCGPTLLEAVGGDVVPDFAGFVARRASGEDWAAWPQASPGDRIRVTARSGAWHDYRGFGPFGDGRFLAAEKGLPKETFVGEVSIESVTNGAVVLNAPLPEGDIAYLVRTSSLPADGDALTAMAGAPGFAFGKVLVDDEGQVGVPHHQATDILVDNRLLPQSSFLTTHLFRAGCPDPTVVARLYYAPTSFQLARRQKWDAKLSVMTEVVR